MENEKVLEMLKEILDGENSYEIVIEYDKGDKELKTKEGYNIALVQDTFYLEDIQLAEELAKKFGLSFTIEDDRLSFFES